MHAATGSSARAAPVRSQYAGSALAAGTARGKLRPGGAGLVPRAKRFKLSTTVPYISPTYDPSVDVTMVLEIILVGIAIASHLSLRYSYCGRTLSATNENYVTTIQLRAEVVPLWPPLYLLVGFLVAKLRKGRNFTFEKRLRIAPKLPHKIRHVDASKKKRHLKRNTLSPLSK